MEKALGKLTDTCMRPETLQHGVQEHENSGEASDAVSRCSGTTSMGSLHISWQQVAIGIEMASGIFFSLSHLLELLSTNHRMGQNTLLEFVLNHYHKIE